MIELDYIVRTEDEKIDELEAELLNMELVDCPLIHGFTDKIYTREILMKAGTLITSKIHKTNHPYFVLQGKVSVKIDNGDWQLIEAPFRGVTKVGTRRVLYIWENTVWVTCHYNEDNCEDIETIENRILEPHINCVINKDINKVYKELLNYKKELL